MTGETLAPQLPPEDEIDLLLTKVEPITNPMTGTLNAWDSRQLEDGSEIQVSISDRGQMKEYSLLSISTVDSRGYDIWETFDLSSGTYLFSRKRANQRVLSSVSPDEERLSRPLNDQDRARATGLIAAYKAAPKGEVVDPSTDSTRSTETQGRPEQGRGTTSSPQAGSG